MNDRLKELMIEAGYAAPELAGRANKLAELIVRECVDYLEVEYGQSALTGNAAAKSVKKHFGVQE